MTKKIKCALIGPGNIGTDLLYKLQRSPVLEPGLDGRRRPGPRRASSARSEMGLKTTDQGIDGLVPHVKADGIQIAFDATSAYVHAENSPQAERTRRADDRPDPGGDRPLLRAAGQPASSTSARAK
jgi:acetaldehyde/propanal dehydrogenase